MKGTFRADLHVHTRASRACGTLKFLGSRDCYSAPEDVYRVAKSRGMDLVAVTDHDVIDGALELAAAHPEDVIVGEEVSCWLADGRLEVHLGVYGMTERLHSEIQPLRGNALEVMAALREAKVFFALNHLFHFYRGQMPLDAYLEVLDAVPALEARNGTMLAEHNLLAETLAIRSPSGRRLGMIGGSDAHTLRRIGRTWTEAPGSNREEFLASLRAGLGRPQGEHGIASTVYGDAYGVVGRYVASLFGLGPKDHHGLRRIGCIAFSALSLPGQFLPAAIAVRRKVEEARAVRQAKSALGRDLAVTAPSAVAGR